MAITTLSYYSNGGAAYPAITKQMSQKTKLEQIEKETTEALLAINPKDLEKQNKIAEKIHVLYGEDISIITRMSVIMFHTMLGRIPTEGETKLLYSLNGAAFQYGYSKAMEEINNGKKQD